MSDHDSDLDLDKPLLPISGYMREREVMLEHMFRSISRRKLRAMLPEILKVGVGLELGFDSLQFSSSFFSTKYASLGASFFS